MKVYELCMKVWDDTVAVWNKFVQPTITQKIQQVFGCFKFKRIIRTEYIADERKIWVLQILRQYFFKNFFGKRLAK